MTQYVYYARKVGEPDWKEQIVLVLNEPLTDRQSERLYWAMEDDNFDHDTLREAIYRGEAPDFAGTVNV
jgi:hypothetical protein